MLGGRLGAEKLGVVEGRGEVKRAGEVGDVVEAVGHGRAGEGEAQGGRDALRGSVADAQVADQFVEGGDLAGEGGGAAGGVLLQAEAHLAGHGGVGGSACGVIRGWGRGVIRGWARGEMNGWVDEG